METNELIQKIEGLLFAKGEPLSIIDLVALTREPKSKIIDACNTLRIARENSGIVVITNDESVALGTHPSLAPFIEHIRKEELEKELSKASLETLAIVLYKKNVTRAEIDYIRGVNSSFILRALLIRGLIKKEIHPEDARKFMYKATLDLIRYLGITSLDELENKGAVEDALQSFIANSADSMKEESL